MTYLLSEMHHDQERCVQHRIDSLLVGRRAVNICAIARPHCVEGRKATARCECEGKVSGRGAQSAAEHDNKSVDHSAARVEAAADFGNGTDRQFIDRQAGCIASGNPP